MGTIVSKFARLSLLFAASALVTCDSFQEDLIEPDKEITINESATNYYILPNSSTVIDLKALVISSFTSATLIVSEGPTRGELTSLGDLLLKYDPAINFTEGVDHFKVDFTNNGKILKKLDLIIHVSEDTTQFPCGLAVQDLVCVKSGGTVAVLFLNNDKTCGIIGANVQTTIYLPPEHGRATIKDDTIFYTPADEYEGQDQLIYRLVTKGDDVVTSFGIIIIPPPTKIQFEATAQNVTEGNEVVISIPFNRAVACDGLIHVNTAGTAVYNKLYTTLPATNNGSIEIPVDKGQTTAQIKVTTINNEQLENSKSVVYTLTNPDEGLRLDTLISLTLTIDDDEGPSLANFATNVGTVNENSGGIPVQIPFSSPVNGEGSMTVTYAPAGAVYGTDFTTSPALVNNSITFVVEENQTSASFVVLPVNNDLFTDNYTLSFSIAAVTGVVQKGNNVDYSLIILDDEVPSVASFVTNEGVVDENDGDGIVIEIPLSSAVKGEGTITLSIDPGQAIYGTNFVSIPEAFGNSMTLDLSHNATSVHFTIVPLDNSSCSTGNNHISFIISSVTGVIRKGNDDRYALEIKDDDTSLVSFAGSSATVAENNEEGIIVRLNLSKPATEDGFFDVFDNSQKYGTLYTTNPEGIYTGNNFAPYVTRLAVQKGATSLELTIFPIDDFIHNTDIRSFLLLMSDEYGCLKGDPTKSQYSITIEDNEPEIIELSDVKYVVFGPSDPNNCDALTSFTLLKETSPGVYGTTGCPICFSQSGACFQYADELTMSNLSDGKYAFYYDIIREDIKSAEDGLDFTATWVSSGGTTIYTGHDSGDLLGGTEPVQYFEKRGNSILVNSSIDPGWPSPIDLNVVLTWDAGSGTPGDVNLDLQILQLKPNAAWDIGGATGMYLLKASENAGSEFEAINAILSNDDIYLFVVDYIAGSSNNVTFKLTISPEKGTINSTTSELSITGSYTLINQGRSNCIDRIGACNSIVSFRKSRTNIKRE